MEVKDVQANQGKIDLVLMVKEKGDERSFEKFGKKGRVCSIKAEDSSGEIKITLWNDDVDKVGLGDKIHLKNGWCSEYQGEKQLSAGKFGEIEVLEKGEVKPKAEQKSSKAKEMEEESEEEEPIDEEETVE